MNCEQAEELLGAYAVDALPRDEATQFRAHLATCADHAARAREMRAFAATLAETIEPMAPPPRLRGRVLSAVAREPQIVRRPSPAVTPAQLHPDRPEMPARASRRTLPRPFDRVRPVQAWGALAAALIVGLLAWNIALQMGGESDAERFAIANADAVAPLLAGDEAVGSVLYFEDDKKAAVIADGVPSIDDTQTYQMWAIAEGAPKSIGLMSPDASGRAHSIVDFDASRADTFAVTIEPAGGSDAPTSDPVLVATIFR